MKPSSPFCFLPSVVLVCFSLVGYAAADPSSNLRIVIIRHGEKPKNGENLTCQGENRARQLPAVISKKFGKPDYTYVPALGLGPSTLHARMYQTVTPLAIRYDLEVNSGFAGNDFVGLSDSVLKRTGTVLMVWNHSYVMELAEHLGVQSPPIWSGKDFDGIWIITYPQGKAVLTLDREGLSPSYQCSDLVSAAAIG